jgi:DNA-binding FadR family transcriptional regulator
MPTQILPARRSLSKEVVEIVSRKIISGEFPKHTYLPPERELCRTVGVSRTVVREAIKSLESCGLLQVERGKGVLVIDGQEQHLSLSIKRLVEQRGHMVQHLMEFRHIMEVAVAGLAADRRTPANLAAMKRWLEIMREKPGEPAGYVDADVEFHNEIARATQNPTLMVLLEPISDLLRDSRIASFSGIRGVRLRTEQHEEILRMIEHQNAEGARLAMARHLNDTVSDLTQRLHKRASPPA